MTSCTDPLGLNDHKLFKELCSSLPKDLGKNTRNILEIRENILYVWHAEKSCILTLDVNATRNNTEDAVYQVSSLLLPIINFITLPLIYYFSQINEIFF